MKPMIANRALLHVERITRERERPHLELALAVALREVLEATAVRLLKLSRTPGESFAWPAVAVDAGGGRILDDGVSLPIEMSSLERLPRHAACLDAAAPRVDAAGALLPLIHADGSAFGIVEADGAAPEAECLELATRLQAVFLNVVALLDYSEVDTLTGLLNRKTFDDTLLRILAALAVADDTRVDAVKLPRRRRGPADVQAHTLAVIDIDHFKRVNDNFGHLIGDEVLLLVATMMKACFRAHDKLFRFGGEEFVVLLKPAGAEAAERAFERFRAAIAARDFPQVGRVTISIGFARIVSGDQPSVILDRADEALYWAKEHGRNRVAGHAELVARGELAAKTAASEVEIF